MVLGTKIIYNPPSLAESVWVSGHRVLSLHGAKRMEEPDS